MVDNKKIAKPDKKVDISRIFSSIPPRLSKKMLEKYKFYKGKGKNTDIQANLQKDQSYTQASKSNIEDIKKLRKTFLIFQLGRLKRSTKF